jgi:glycosyltransferase involved in cell wall biosynthesis
LSAAVWGILLPNRKPDLNLLPPPPPGKAGWPWTEESEPMPEKTPDGKPWPKISIVTPSYNQGKFIEETIRSVLLQNYPNLEYIIIDGGSTDNSVEIIKKYEPWLTYWVSEQDRGQADALNKGFDKATGKVRAYLNSDDIYFPNIFKEVASIFARDEEIIKWLVMPVELTGDINPYIILPSAPLKRKDWLKGKFIFCQPGVFWIDEIHNNIDKFDSKYDYSFDERFFIDAFFRGFIPYAVSGIVAARFLYHASSKSGIEGAKKNRQSHFFTERKKTAGEYAGKLQRIDKIDVINYWRQLAMDEALMESNNISDRLLKVIRFISVAFEYPDCFMTRFFWGVTRKLLLGKL